MLYSCGRNVVFTSNREVDDFLGKFVVVIVVKT